MRANVRQALQIYYEFMKNCNWYSGGFAIALLLNGMRKGNEIGVKLHFYYEVIQF